MFRSLLLLILSCALMALTARGQAPGTSERHDIDGDYRKPDLQAPLFDALTLPLSSPQVESVLHDLQLIARNFPNSAAVNHRMRSHALALALRLSPDDRPSVVANGQLARGVVPAPLPGNGPPDPEGVAQRLFAVAFPLLSVPEKSGRDFALLVLDLCRRLDPRLQPQIFAFTYGASPDWHDVKSARTLLDEPPSFHLFQTEVQVVLPGLDNGRIRTFSVKALARPVPAQKGLKLALPEVLRREMADPKKEPLRLEVEQRMTALRSALRLRHEIWPEGWVVEISVPDANVTALPQVFTGIALTVDSLLSGEPIEAQSLVAVGTDAAGKLQGVLLIEELLPAVAEIEPPPVIILPPDAGDQIDDWMLMHADQWPLLFRLTLHRAPALTDAMALLESGKAPKLERSLTSFAELAARLRAAADPLVELRRPATVAQLKEITAWHPQHLSASALLSVAAGGPGVLTVNGSLTHLDRLARCVLSTDRAKFPLHTPRSRFEKSDFGKSGDSVQSAMRILHPSVRAYAEQVITLARMLDRVAGHWDAYLKKNGPPDPPDVSRQRARAAGLRAGIPRPVS